MKNSVLLKVLPLGLTALALCTLPQSASAQSSVYSISLVGTVNQPSPGISTLDEHSVNNNSLVSASTDSFFTGLDGQGNTQTMEFSGQTNAQSDYGFLHVYTTGTVTNSYYNKDNTPYEGSTGKVDLSGSPTTLCSLGFAGFNDTLQFGGVLQSGYTARYVFHVDGTNSGVGAAADLAVNVENQPSQGFFDFGNGPFAADWTTREFAVNGVTPQNINVQFSDQVVFNTYDLNDGGTYSGTSDFADTASLVGIEVFDQNGKLAPWVTVTSGSGTAYKTVQSLPAAPGAVPFLMGLIGVARKRRRSIK